MTTLGNPAAPSPGRIRENLVGPRMPQALDIIEVVESCLERGEIAALERWTCC
jgi:hypothetical protein